ncbi:GH32 C-terminal domain-containing protein [Massilia sp. GCM10020059]|uniref:GH32 C-terminal domain-containing protein n=1 Tax=Massilia TaxID=149698 RepID=UPI003530E65F
MNACSAQPSWNPGGFADDGEVVLTGQVFPGPGSNGIAIFSEGGQALVADFNIWAMKPIRRVGGNP